MKELDLEAISEGCEKKVSEIEEKLKISSEGNFNFYYIINNLLTPIKSAPGLYNNKELKEAKRKEAKEMAISNAISLAKYLHLMQNCLKVKKQELPKPHAYFITKKNPDPSVRKYINDLCMKYLKPN